MSKIAGYDEGTMDIEADGGFSGTGSDDEALGAFGIGEEGWLTRLGVELVSEDDLAFDDALDQDMDLLFLDRDQAQSIGNVSDFGDEAVRAVERYRFASKRRARTLDSLARTGQDAEERAETLSREATEADAEMEQQAAALVKMGFPRRTRLRFDDEYAVSMSFSGGSGCGTGCSRGVPLLTFWNL